MKLSTLRSHKDKGPMNREEARHISASARWQRRKSPLELGGYHASLGRKREDNPFSESQPQSRADWFQGWDEQSE